MTRGDGSPLRRLDERVLPRSAARLQAALAAARSVTRSPRSRVAVVLAAVRREPTLAAAIAAVAVAAVLIVTVDGHRGGASTRSAATPPTIAALGPLPGTPVAAYLRTAARDLQRVSRLAGTQPVFAVVDLRDYQTPAQAAQTFSGVDVVRAYVRVPDRRLPTQVHSVTVHGVLDLTAQLRTTAVVAAATAKSYGVLVSHLHPRSRADRLVKERYDEQRRAAVREAHLLARPARCGCVFAVVVHADVTHLAALIRLSTVRVVDPAPPTVSLSGISVFPLEPEITTAVPRSGVVGG